MKPYKKWLLTVGIAAGSVALEACLIPLRGYSLNVSGIAAMIVFAVYTYCCLAFVRNIKPGIIVISIMTGLLAVHLPVRIIYWEGTLISFPDMIMHFVGVAFGFAFRVSGKRGRLWLLAPLFALTAVGYIYGFHLFVNKLNYDTWTGKVEQVTLTRPMVFDTPGGETKILEEFKGNYLVLDFWNTSCGVCYTAFPDVQKLYDKYKDHHGIDIFAVHCRAAKDNETCDTGDKILSGRGYSFPSLSMDMKDPILLEAGVDGYPTVLIFTPNNKLVFRGNIDDAGRYIDKNMI